MTIDASAYRAALAALAAQVASEARGACDASALRLLRLRLVQWVEDMRSAGNDELARAVDALIHRLSTALHGGARTLAREATAVAEALAALAQDVAPPPTKKPSRLAFWK